MFSGSLVLMYHGLQTPAPYGEAHYTVSADNFTEQIKMLAHEKWVVRYPDLLAGRIIYPLAVMALSVYLLFVIVLFYSFFIDFYLDEMIITNDRLIDIEQNGLLARTIAETDLYLIQDVTSEIKGLFASIFKYGRVVIQTAGATPKFIVVDIPDPNGLRRLLLDLASEDKKFHNIIK